MKCHGKAQNGLTNDKQQRKKGFEDMSVGLFNAQYKLGIDTTTLKQVSNEILKRAAEKNSRYNTNNSVLNNFRAADMGIDLYKREHNLSCINSGQPDFQTAG